jgi:phytoene synthase
VAGVVGILMAKIFKTPTTGNAYIAAEKLGIAMQITNILRDIKEDFEKNRIYIPISLLDKFGVNDSHLNLKFDVSTVNENFLNVIDDLAQYAISCYKTAYDGIKFIPDFRSRLCVKLMIAIYGSILGKILINKMIVFKKRVIVSKFNKIIICLKVILGFHPLRVANLNGEKNLYEKI